MDIQHIVQQPLKLRSVPLEYKKFEIPYNFSKETISKLLPYKNIIETVYIPAYKEHCHSTRFEYGLDPNNLEEYLDHLEFLQNQGLPVSILLQEDRLLDKSIVKFYLDRHINSFIVRNDDTARLIKSIDSSIEIIASITKLLTVEEINTLDLSMYDKIVLDFRLNDLESVSKLPTKYKYILMPNTLCSKNANPKMCRIHWDCGDKLKCNLKCYNPDNPNLAIISPYDLHKFDKYICTYKLQGRERQGNDMYEYILPYLTEYKRENFN